MNNLVPLPYSRISVQTVDVGLDQMSIKSFLCGKEAYFETDYVVLRRGGECAVVSVHKARADGLFWLIEDVEILSLPDSCRWLDDSAVDTGNPSALAEKARALGVTEAETLVVNGRYEHVNFIHRPQPLVIHVFDLSPPEPPRLVDMTRQVVAYTDLPAVVLTAHIQSIPELVRDVDDKPILFPCGVSQLKRHTNAFYLDERPPRQDWVLVGCDKSRMIHRHLYGDDCSSIELCPKKLFSVDARPALMRCCMVEKRFDFSDGVAVVPWGAERSLIEHACEALLGSGDPTKAADRDIGAKRARSGSGGNDG